MKSYKEFATEAQYLDEKWRIKNPFKGKPKPGKPKPDVDGGKPGKPRQGGSGIPGMVGTGAVAGAVGTGLSALGNLAGNLVKGALGAAKNSANKHGGEESSAGREMKGLDKIT